MFLRKSVFLTLMVLFGMGMGTDSFAQETAVDENPEPLTTQPVSRLDEAWWKERHEAKLKAKDRHEHWDIVLLGDSITQSWEGPGKRVWEKTFGDLNSLNLGFSGDRTEHVLWRLQHGQIDGIRPDVVMLMIGTNNTGHRMDSPKAVAAGVRAIVEHLTQELPETHILLLGLFPYDEKPDSPRRKNNQAINGLIGELHDGQRVHYLDISDRFLTDEGWMTREITPDFLHLSAAGYQRWANGVESKLRELCR